MDFDSNFANAHHAFIEKNENAFDKGIDAENDIDEDAKDEGEQFDQQMSQTITKAEPKWIRFHARGNRALFPVEEPAAGLEGNQFLESGEDIGIGGLKLVMEGIGGIAGIIGVAIAVLGAEEFLAALEEARPLRKEGNGLRKDGHLLHQGFVGDLVAIVETVIEGVVIMRVRVK